MLRWAIGLERGTGLACLLCAAGSGGSGALFLGAGPRARGSRFSQSVSAPLPRRSPRLPAPLCRLPAPLCRDVTTTPSVRGPNHSCARDLEAGVVLRRYKSVCLSVVHSFYGCITYKLYCVCGSLRSYGTAYTHSRTSRSNLQGTRLLHRGTAPLGPLSPGVRRRRSGFAFSPSSTPTLEEKASHDQDTAGLPRAPAPRSTLLAPRLSFLSL